MTDVVEGATPTVEPEAVESAPVAPNAVDFAPKRKWHDRKWLLITSMLFIGLLVGMVMALPDRTIAEKEGRDIVAEAKSDREAILDDARADGADEIADANAESDKILGGIEKKRDDIADEVATLTATRTRLTSQKKTIAADVRSLKKELGKLTREKAMGTFEGDGIFLVGSDIMTGTYKAPASPGCYYALLSSLDGGLNGIQSNGNVDGPVVFSVTSGTKAVEVARCGTFTRVG
ncbi:MAG: Uncharacterized protein JWO69_1481 [Thermoleophilia bacterium]|jgi:hypothetical protein|nr:Uncharacterized protein [Thermoleophilia bacterium]